MASPDRDRLARYVRRRRNELGMRNRRELEKRVAALGMHRTDRTLGKVENAERVGEDTYTVIEVALGWASGSARDILDGGEPSPAGDTAPPAPSPVPGDPVLRDAWDRLAGSALPDDVKLIMIRAAQLWQESQPQDRGTREGNSG